MPLKPPPALGSNDVDLGGQRMQPPASPLAQPQNGAGNSPPAPPAGAPQGTQGTQSGSQVPVQQATPQVQSQAYWPKHVRSHTKVRLLAEQIARLRCQGVNDQKILLILGITQPRFSRIVKLDAFKQIEEAIMANTLTQFDAILATRTDLLRSHFAAAIPAAFRFMVDTVLNNKADLKHRLEAAREILDRDPKKTFTKNSVIQAGLPGSEALPEDILASRTREANELRSRLIN